MILFLKYMVLTGKGKGAGLCARGAKGGRRGAGGGAAAAGGAGARSGCGLRGSRTGPVSGNANTCDCGSGKLMGLETLLFLTWPF